MAIITISNTGGNWNSTSTWDGGVIPTSSDDIIGTASSGPLTINVGVSAKSLDLTFYNDTITYTSNLSITGTTNSSGASITTEPNVILNGTQSGNGLLRVSNPHIKQLNQSRVNFHKTPGDRWRLSSDFYVKECQITCCAVSAYITFGTYSVYVNGTYRGAGNSGSGYGWLAGIDGDGTTSTGKENDIIFDGSNQTMTGYHCGVGCVFDGPGPFFTRIDSNEPDASALGFTSKYFGTSFTKQQNWLTIKNGDVSQVKILYQGAYSNGFARGNGNRFNYINSTTQSITGFFITDGTLGQNNNTGIDIFITGTLSADILSFTKRGYPDGSDAIILNSNDLRITTGTNSHRFYGGALNVKELKMVGPLTRLASWTNANTGTPGYNTTNLDLRFEANQTHNIGKLFIEGAYGEISELNKRATLSTITASTTTTINIQDFALIKDYDVRDINFTGQTAYVLGGDLTNTTGATSSLGGGGGSTPITTAYSFIQ